MRLHKKTLPFRTTGEAALSPCVSKPILTGITSSAAEPCSGSSTFSRIILPPQAEGTTQFTDLRPGW